MIQNHVTSLELSKEMKALGFPQESEFYWGKNTYGVRVCFYAEEKVILLGYVDVYSAYLSSELGKWLLEKSYVEKFKKGWHSFMDNDTVSATWESGYYVTLNNMTDSMALLLIHLAKEGIIDPKKLK